MSDENLPAIQTMEPGVILGLGNDAYHSGPGISRSGLWTIYEKTPAHFRYPPEKEPKKHFEFGSAVDLAILEPENFEKLVWRGPDDRKGNKWTTAEADAKSSGAKHILPGPEFDRCLLVRDAIMSVSHINNIITGGTVDDTNLTQPSAYWIDEQTGVLCKCRPDKVRTDLGVMLDLKTAQDASPIGFASAVARYGYHCEEGWYTEGWAAAGEAPIQGFVFLVVEKESPFAFGLYELDPNSTAEGNAIMRRALDTYAKCMKTDVWPAYGDGVQEISIPNWAFKETRKL